MNTAKTACTTPAARLSTYMSASTAKTRPLRPATRSLLRRMACRTVRSSLTEAAIPSELRMYAMTEYTMLPSAPNNSTAPMACSPGLARAINAMAGTSKATGAHIELHTCQSTIPI